jgi:hypothetical protein
LGSAYPHGIDRRFPSTAFGGLVDAGVAVGWLHRVAIDFPVMRNEGFSPALEGMTASVPRSLRRVRRRLVL